MTGGHHIRSSFVHSGMNQKTCRVCRSAHVPSDGIPVVIHEDHVTGFE